MTIFLPYYKSKVKLRTYNNRISSMKIHFQYFYKMKVSEIQPIYIQKWQSKLVAEYSNSYIRNIYGLFQMVLDRAVILGMALSNYAKSVGNVRKQKKKVEFLTIDEFEKVASTFFVFVDDFYQHFLYISLWVLFMTGMRIGEATAIQWKDIDFESSLLSVTKTLYCQNSGNYEFVESKTRASKRLTTLNKDILELLKQWKKR